MHLVDLKASSCEGKVGPFRKTAVRTERVLCFSRYAKSGPQMKFRLTWRCSWGIVNFYNANGFSSRLLAAEARLSLQRAVHLRGNLGPVVQNDDLIRYSAQGCQAYTCATLPDGLLFLIAIRKAIQEIYDIDQTVIK